MMNDDLELMLDAFHYVVDEDEHERAFWALTEDNPSDEDLELVNKVYVNRGV